MKKVFLLISSLFVIFTTTQGQTASQGLVIHQYAEASYVDSPNFSIQRVRFDMRNRISIGAPGSGNYTTNMTIVPWPDASGGLGHQLTFNDGGIFYRNGSLNSTAWNSWRKLIVTSENGNVGIGTDNPQNKLDVNGTIRAKEIVVETGWADFVFSEKYKLPTLEEVKTHIEENKHLPGIPSETEMKEKGGTNLGEMQVLLLQKIEELTLYAIQQQETIDKLNEKIEDLGNNMKK